MAATNHCKPLFNRHLLEEARRAFVPALDEEQRRIAASWAASAANGSLLGQKEKPLQGQFLSQVLDRLLGYHQIVGSDGIHHMEPETSSKAVKGYRPPDARLGWYGQDIDRTRAVLELKAPGANLDAKQGAAYGRLTPVEQAFGYAAKVDGCRWVLVSNFIELRLYRTDRGQGYCRRFALADLADAEHLRTFLFLLTRESLFGTTLDTDSPVERLATHTYAEEDRISKAFYVFYRDLRANLFDHLRRDNPAPAGQAAEAHGVRLLELTQKILDRCLFICFCEDTGLLPPKILTQALTAKSEGFVQVSRWQQLCGLFRAVDLGHPPMKINGYNGGLFAADADLEALQVSDICLDGIEKLAGYDFETDLNVNILGHIFEQSISDLEALRAEIHGTTADKQRSRRKRDGIFYTPELITRFMVSRTIGGWLTERLAEIEARHRTGKPGPMSNETRLKVWVDYLDVLGRIKVLDLACGSGAFLVAAFDELLARYEQANRAIAELQGTPMQLGLFDLDRQILQENLFGVDLNPESVEITKLSLWLKTARRDKPLNNLDANIRCGNSLIEPPASGASSNLAEAFASLLDVHRAFDWRSVFPQVFAQGGFDIAIGNPPYVRQEVLGPIKPYLAQRYASYHGVADLYVYFYERGLELLAPQGKLSFIVTNKWLRAGYGEPLRRHFAERAQLEEILDFGHAPIFEDADTFPCIIVAHRKPLEPAPEPATVQVCPVPRDRSTELSLDTYVHEHGYPVPWSRYDAEPWSLEPPEVDGLMGKLRERGVPLSEILGAKPMYGIKTGLNEAFLIDDAARAELIRQDPGCADIIKPYLRGQDIKRWTSDWQGLWMIVLKSSQTFAWPWHDAGENAEAVFAQTYPSLHAHMKTFEERLRRRQDKGRYWWELRSCDYYEAFDQPKIVYQVIQFHPQFALDLTGLFGNDKTFLLPTSDHYLLAVLNAPLLWWHNWRYLPHMKDEALNPAGFRMETLPIAEPSPEIRREVEEGASAAIELTRASQHASRELLTWLRVELDVEKPGQRLESFAELTADEFAAEVRKRRPKGAPRLTPKIVTELADTHRQYATAETARAAQRRAIERRLSDLVIQAYRLTDDEIDLLWRTAPPRMPLSGG
ncbi:Eco57I restriction endonuclease [Thiorhodococcus drewsii AZ1]|uniref:site-specific DNA-methyltransferase (adenine-specific) n=1 Tax=Thiorhodococcus drewsii AZ1 TaxID=765913 RepID=G2E5P2_9GAMM|nr:Eco57I restriction-modification methylase domain-containing protein [Thiorhodococcus drewsii]EGV28613.1 Eco57I restriction endonuclease [Thiorhodococcus drewsii AZ1]